MLTLENFPPISSPMDLAVNFGDLLCDGLNCSILSFKNFAGGIDVSLTIPLVTDDGFVTVTAVFVGVPAEVVGGDSTATYTRSVRRASVSFLYTRPVALVSSALYCAECNQGYPSLPCLVNGLCGLQQYAPEPNSIASSGNGVLTVVVENYPLNPLNETNGEVASPSAVFVTIANEFAAVLRVLYQSGTQLAFEVQASGPIQAGDATMQIVIQPDTTIPITATVLFELRVYNEEVNLTCESAWGCAAPMTGSESLFIRIYNFPLTDQDSIDQISVLFGNILVSPELVNCTASFCILQLNPPNYFCGSCQSGFVTVPLRLIYSATGNEITSTPFSFWASPSIDSARFDATAVQIIVTFDQPTNRAGATSPAARCSSLLNSTAELGVDPQCIWLSDSVLSVLLGPEASIEPGFVLLISGEAGLRSASGVSQVSSASAIVQGPLQADVAGLLNVQGPSTIDSCSSLELNAFAIDAPSSSPITYSWSCLNDAFLNSLLVTTNGPNLKVAAAAPEISSVGKVYEIMVQAADMFSASRGSAVVRVLQQGWPVPSVSFLPLPSSGINVNTPVLVRGQVAFSSCPVPTDSFQFSWRVLSGPVTNLPQGILESGIPQVTQQLFTLVCVEKAELHFHL